MNEILYRQIENILRCPKTGKKLILDLDKQRLITPKNESEYLINDDIIDFVPEESKENIDNYAERAKRYEKIFVKPNVFIRIFDKLMWGISHNDYAPDVVEFIPENFTSVLLDIPVGTGLFTCERYGNLPNAIIIVADYSINMIKFAKKRYTERNIKNVIYLHADVGRLPFVDQSIELTISMNGYHAFPDKNKALNEIARVTKAGGQFIGCFYARGVKKSTDWVVNNYYSRKGWFKPPFYTIEEILEKFGRFFKFKTSYNRNAMFVYDSIRFI
ncbi:MAG: methyltransferase domain-containing protein [Candidatus Hermodarchaeota archaeon]